MPLKKKTSSDDEIDIYDEAIVYRRGDYWQMRMWLSMEKKYARFSLKTRSRDTAIDKAKKYFHELMAQQNAGKTYFSMTAKQGVDEYIKQRNKDMEVGLIVKGRLGTIKTHLGHWLDFIGRDAKLKEMERTDCENYFHSRTKTKKNVSISQTTVANEQSTINAMMHWQFKRNEAYIEGFDFKPLKRIDRGDEALRRSIFREDELRAVRDKLESYVAEAKRDIDDGDNFSKAITGYYLLVSMISGLRKGEQRQLKWGDITHLEPSVAGGDEDETRSLVKIQVRAETTKVRKTRHFVVEDKEYFEELFNLTQPRYVMATKDEPQAVKFAHTLVFSKDGQAQLTSRAIGYLFDKMLEDAEIKDTDSRTLVPYSFRHNFITDMINRGANATQVAETCGTSTMQIERTYYHTTEEKMIINAMPGFDYRDGLLIPK